MRKFLSVLEDLENEKNKGITFIVRGEESFLSYSDLYHQSPRVAGKLAARGVRPGQHVVFQLTGNRDLIDLFWGCIWLGAIPVAAPPAVSTNDQERVSRIADMLPDAVILTDERTAPHIHSERCLPVQTVNSTETYEELPLSETNGESIRLVQMSSGSTGDPKGIILTEETLMSAMQATIPRQPQRFENCMLTWLPLTHNFSLLGFHVYSIFRGYSQVLMPTSDFIMNPLNWFEAISRHRATVTVCPNFGFVHVLRYLKARGIPEGASYDLSSVQKIISASEPVDSRAAHAFCEALAKFGLRSNAVVVAYGMSEACLQISTTQIYEPLTAVCLDRARVAIGARYVDIAQPDGAEFVSVGQAVPGMEVSIRDNAGEQLSPDTVGEIYIRGTSLTHESIGMNGVVEHDLTSDGFLATGDIGLIHEGNLYVVARKKDIIFVNGKNYYSPDLESLLMTKLEIETVVLGRTDPQSGEEQVVVFVPVTEKNVSDKDIIGVMATDAGIPVSRIMRIDAIPHTANGKKLRRELEVLL